MKTLEQVCHEALAEIRRGGASVSVWREGAEIFSIARGAGWDTDTLVPVFSVTKMISAATLLLALSRQGYDEQMEIGLLWPRFPAPRGTIAQLLSHQLGLAALARPACLFDLVDCRLAIEQTTPAWQPPQLGYHPHTLGPILAILMLELTGERLWHFWEREIRAPHDLDVYLGNFSEELYPRIKRLRPPHLADRPELGRDAFYRDYLREGTQVHAAFHSIRGLDSIRKMNEPRAWHCGDPAKGAVASARGLARFYQLLMGQGSPLFSPELRRALTTVQVRGEDCILQQPMSYSCGALMEKQGVIPQGGFGHAGAGGAHACAQFASGISFAYVTDQMEWGILPSARVQRMVEAINCASGYA